MTRTAIPDRAAAVPRQPLQRPGRRAPDRPAAATLALGPGPDWCAAPKTAPSQRRHRRRAGVGPDLPARRREGLTPAGGARGAVSNPPPAVGPHAAEPFTPLTFRLSHENQLHAMCACCAWFVHTRCSRLTPLSSSNFRPLARRGPARGQ